MIFREIASVMIFIRNHKQFGVSLKSQLQTYDFHRHQHGIKVSLQRKSKGEKTRRHTVITIQFEGVRSPRRGKLACVHSRMNEVSQVETFLFSKIHFLVMDGKHVIMQGFSLFLENIKACLENMTKLALYFPQSSKNLHD